MSKKIPTTWTIAACLAGGTPGIPEEKFEETIKDKNSAEIFELADKFKEEAVAGLMSKYSDWRAAGLLKSAWFYNKSGTLGGRLEAAKIYAEVGPKCINHEMVEYIGGYALDELEELGKIFSEGEKSILEQVVQETVIDLEKKAEEIAYFPCRKSREGSYCVECSQASRIYRRALRLSELFDLGSANYIREKLKSLGWLKD